MKTVSMINVLTEAEVNSVVCITTNGVVKRDGSLVMGAGFAKQVADVVPTIPKLLGSYVSKWGNRCFKAGTYMLNGREIAFASFPTKNSYKDKSDLELIKTSAQQIKDMADKFQWTKVYLPAPGCGLGELRWEDVRSVIEPILDDRFNIVFKAKEGSKSSSIPVYAPKDLGVKKGHVQLINIANLKNIDMSLYTKKLFIVRSLAKAESAIEKYGLIHVPQLSPSAQLFKDYYGRWKKGDFTEQEVSLMATGATHTWWDLYVKRFIAEMNNRDDFRVNINRVMELLDQGTNILMVCFCPEVQRCHRGIIGYFLAKKGYEVKFN